MSANEKHGCHGGDGSTLPDPMAQIEAALDRHVRYVTNQYTSHNECDRSREALLALIRSALAAQPGQKEAENAWKQLECVGLSVRGRAVTLIFKNDPTAKAAFKRLNGINATPPAPTPDEAGVRAALIAFADFLHQLPDENGYEVGPMRIKYENGQAVDGPWWVGQDDTRRWVDLFLAGYRAALRHYGILLPTGEKGQ